VTLKIIKAVVVVEAAVAAHMILIRIQISHGAQREDKLKSEIKLNHSRTNII
jgi:hypothetical protein